MTIIKAEAMKAGKTYPLAVHNGIIKIPADLQPRGLWERLKALFGRGPTLYVHIFYQDPA